MERGYIDMAANTTSNNSGDTIISNPYPGPVPFDQQYSQYFFGRDGEKMELMSMIVANRVVFLYAQSGAGKTSLLNASLLPSLRAKGFEVLPVVRPGIPMPDGVSPSEVTNIFAFNTLREWTNDANPRSLLTKSVSDFLAEDYARRVSQTPENEAGRPARIIVLDQFEEIFTRYVERWKDRESFFLQLAEALDPDPEVWEETVKRLRLTGPGSEPDRTLRVLFVLREDYLASLHSYADLLPIRPAARVRIERLRKDAACEAVERPAQLVNKPFLKDEALKLDVAVELVEKLLENRVEVTNGEVASIEGEFVEPVQLQIVCKKLLESLPPGKNQIDSDDVEKLGDLNEPLASFYDKAVQDAANKSGEKESALRDWFESSLITPAGTRGTVFRDGTTQKAAGIAIKAVELLDKAHLVRGEMRSGALWYELTHDKFIEPILLANKRWRDALSPGSTRRELEDKAAEWSRSAADKTKLLNENDLMEAESWITTREAKELGYSAILVAFIQASRARNKTRKLRRFAVALAVLIVLTSASAVYAYYTKGQLQSAKEELEEAYRRLQGEYDKTEKERKNAEEQAGQAESARVYAEAQKGIAQAAQRKAEEQTGIAEEERKRAQGQAKLAEDARAEAEEQRGIAQEAQKQAEEQASQAEAAKREAERQEAIAREEKARAERLSRVSQSQALAAQSRLGDDPLVSATQAIDAISITFPGDKIEEIGQEPKMEVVTDALYSLQNALRGVLLEPTPFRLDGDIDPPPGFKMTGLGFNQPGPDQTSPTLFAVTNQGNCIGWSTAADSNQPNSFLTYPGFYRDLQFGAGEFSSNATLSPDGTLAAFAIKQNVGTNKEDKVAMNIKIFDVTEKADPITIVGHERGVHKLAFSDAISDDGRRYLATSNTFGNYKVTEINLKGMSEKKWSEPTLMEKLRVRFGGQLKFLGIKGDQFRLANAFVFSHYIKKQSENLLLATGFQDGRVVIRDAATGGNDFILPEGYHSDSILAMAFSQDNKFLLVSSRDDNLIAWHIGSKPGEQGSDSGKKKIDKNKTMNLEQTILHTPFMMRFGIMHRNPVTSIAFSKDGKYLATGSEDRTVIIWEVQGFQPILQLPDHTAQITDLAFSHDSQWLATVAADNRRRLWDISSLTKLKKLEKELSNLTDTNHFPGETFAADPLKINSLIQGVRDLLDKQKKKN